MIHLSSTGGGAGPNVPPRVVARSFRMGIRSVAAAAVAVAAACLAAPTLAEDDAHVQFRAESATPVEIVTALLSNSATLSGSPLAAT